MDMARLQDRLDQMVRGFRNRGHKIAKIDPLDRPVTEQPELRLEFYDFTPEDLDRPISTRTIGGSNVSTVRRVYDRMHNTYCRSIGVQFMHIEDLALRNWLQLRMEETENRLELTRAQQLRTLENLTNAVVFEEFIQKKFTGAKRFSLEGAETLIPLLETAIELAGEQQTQEVVLAMAHRGRLNVLANIMGKSPRAIFAEFEDQHPEQHRGRGDVKYHLGYSRDWTTSLGKKIHLSLCFNPSHLEFVNPVALGRVRAKQDRKNDPRREKIMAILIHGDAAFAGEGVVQESLNISQVPAYETGGTLHVIVNNQLGFTTPPEQGRSTQYATDIAKMLQVPIFHVNGEDPEAVAQVVNLAMEFRKEFRRDVVIDLYCYRKFGHNEADEPGFTQPEMYRAIGAREGVRDAYLSHLLKLGGVTREEADAIAEHRRETLQQELDLAHEDDFELPREKANQAWSGFHGGDLCTAENVDTGVPKDQLSALLEKLTEVPEGFTLHPKLERFMAGRRKMAADKQPLDWGAAEALAFATLSVEGHPVRLSGQDCERGTFSHRHSVLHDYQTDNTYMPLGNLTPNQAPIEIYNSTLSETAVLGFEYGYSLDRPTGLVLWEAQFGDFVNAAQVIIDQFIVSAEDKWGRLSGLVMLLPHGFEGMGPEHSSARLERFLMLAAEDNIQIVNPTTPAQYFHCLRRQIKRQWRKPLIIMTPKSGLRHKKAVSTLDEFTEGSFQPMLADPAVDADKVERVLVCSGKIAYELEERREQTGREDIAILRLEQLYPQADDLWANALAPYRAGTPVVWVQEEPDNMGAWRFLRYNLGYSLVDGRHPFYGITREASASPATGSAGSHRMEQQELIDLAFGPELPQMNGARSGRLGERQPV